MAHKFDKFASVHDDLEQLGTTGVKVGKCHITNIHCLLTEGLEGTAAVIPSNTVFQNSQQTTRTDPPKGLTNLGLTCYCDKK